MEVLAKCDRASWNSLGDNDTPLLKPLGRRVAFIALVSRSCHRTRQAVSLDSRSLYPGKATSSVAAVRWSRAIRDLRTNCRLRGNSAAMFPGLHPFGKPCWIRRSSRNGMASGLELFCVE